MKKNSDVFGILKKASTYFSKIVLIYRTRNIYGYNSVCMRIFQLFAGSRRQNGKGLRIPRTGFQY